MVVVEDNDKEAQDLVIPYPIFPSSWEDDEEEVTESDERARRRSRN